MNSPFVNWVWNWLDKRCVCGRVAINAGLCEKCENDLAVICRASDNLYRLMKGGFMNYTVTTQCAGDGSNPHYVVYFERQIVALFPVNDPTSPDAREYANRFAATMEGYYIHRKAKLVGNNIALVGVIL
jgi:hypothetical protein